MHTDNDGHFEPMCSCQAFYTTASNCKHLHWYTWALVALAVIFVLGIATSMYVGTATANRLKR